ncbi:MAG: ABC transporter permease [Chloroflexi bacterium]|nr:MAG: putative peptide ABC transporter permease [Chloroflexi bacterium OLB13]MBC6955244.1 ABC transporter permease [Chloroflexota bacterium]MBV6434930.1 Dipeptide transport system permease protein DppB [Anaerolineae bacterium]MDL1916262.1 ABC transporter permease [Anaerolineae bacterium CFX4]OQY81843.1 MAG: ABC transporter substrate-binding protein [Anaerolineae bacterium UTCFX5]
MSKFILRRLLIAIPTLFAISFVVFAILELSPVDPLGNLPLTITPEEREKIREAMGANAPFHVKYAKWVVQFVINEPLNILEQVTGIKIGDSEGRLRYISYQTRSPIVDLVIQRLPQTLWVVGTAYLLSVLIAVPIGVLSAYKPYSIFDQVGTFFAIVGYSLPTFFTGLLFIIIFSVNLKWFPSVYDTTHRVTDMQSLLVQLRQIFMPTLVLALYFTAQISRFTRSSMLEHLNQDYIRTARSKGISERAVIMRHALRNSLIPVVTLVALGIPAIFQGAIITEQIFRVNGLGQLLILAIQGGDLPTVQALTFIFAVLIVIFNIVADVLYALLDPRVRLS